jgi:para-nitrobenzyl esterase
VARRLARHGRVFLYDFAFRARSLGGILRAAHAIEIPFVFGTYDTQLMRLLLAETIITPRLSGEVQDAWAGFARSGTPLLPSGLPWPALDPASVLSAVIDEQWSITDRSYRFEREVWGPHWPVVTASGPTGRSHSIFPAAF